MSNIKYILAIIPARMGSSRFPGKPMKLINNLPMVDVVFRNVKKSKLVKHTIVATCDKIIFEYMKKTHGSDSVIMTKKTHERASDRCAEALIKFEKLKNIKFKIVVLVQGDEPMINYKMVNQSIKPFFKDKTINVVNLFTKIKSYNEFKDPNCIKVVFDKNYDALYFSREAIPNQKNKKNFNAYKQICVIPFNRDILLKYVTLKQTSLEKKESIDMMRFLENNIMVKMIKTNCSSHAVDTINDLIFVRKLLKPR